MTYAAPSPKTISQDTFRELNNLSAYSRIDNFTRLRLTRDAKKLMNVDASAAYTILGILACLALDITKMKENHELAVRKATGDTKIRALTNFAVSLTRIGLHDESVEILESARKNYPGSFAIPVQLLRANIRRGAITEALDNWKAIIRLKKAGETRFFDAGLFEEISAFLKSNNIDESQIVELLSTATSLHMKEKVRSVSTEIKVEIDEEDGEAFLSIMVSLLSTPSSCAELNELLADEITKKSFPDQIIKRVPVSFVAN